MSARPQRSSRGRALARPLDLAPVAFGLALALSLVAGLLALYARDVRRNRTTTRLFALVGVASTLATLAIGWWWL